MKGAALPLRERVRAFSLETSRGLCPGKPEFSLADITGHVHLRNGSTASKVASPRLTSSQGLFVVRPTVALHCPPRGEVIDSGKGGASFWRMESQADGCGSALLMPTHRRETPQGARCGGGSQSGGSF